MRGQGCSCPAEPRVGGWGGGSSPGGRDPICPRLGQATPLQAEARTGNSPKPAFLASCQLRGRLRVTFPASESHGRKSRPGVCWRSSCPRPSLLPAPGPAPQPGSRLRSCNRDAENPSRQHSFRRATVRMGRLLNTSPALLKTPGPRPSLHWDARRGYMCSVLPLICLQ